MATFTGASVTPAATSATASGDLVNVETGYPAATRWPGSVDPSTYTDAGPEYPLEGPPAGPWVLDDFTGTVPEMASGGGIQDTSWTTGTDAPMVPWDSSAGPPFAGSAAADPDLHGEDTGAVYQAQHVPPAYIGTLQRQTIIGQTYNREYQYEPVNGQYVPVPNGRQNLDQRQVWNPAPGDGGGWAPWDPGYSERPIYNNVAYQATPVNTVPTPYGVSGDLPDRSTWSYPAAAYEAPADPVVNEAPAPVQDTGGGWLLG